MNRFVQSLRSLLPADAKQLLLIVGLVCLTIVPRLNWLPSDVPSFIADLSYAGHTSPEEIRQTWVAVVVIVTYAFIFAASAGFFICCWPGKRPARRILLLVVLPAFVGLCAVCARYLSLLASASSPRSVLQRGPAFEHGPGWMISNLLNLGPAFHFCIAGLVLTVAFTVLLARRKTSLPISIANPNAAVAEATDAWKGCKRLIWIFQGAPLLSMLPVTVISFFFLSIYSKRVGTWRFHIYEGLAPITLGIIFFGIASWAMGKENWALVRRQIYFPNFRYAGLALVIPTATTGSLAVAKYVFDRADWAAHAFGRFDPPRIVDYFGIPEVWTATLFLAAFAEEVIFRGVLQKHFIERFGIWRGICFVGIVWGAFHFYADSYARKNDLEIVIALFSRVIFCITLGFILSWLTLRSKSLMPATLTHGLNNIFAYSNPEVSLPGQHWVHLGLLALLAYVLFHYWPVETSAGEIPTPAVVATEPAV